MIGLMLVTRPASYAYPCFASVRRGPHSPARRNSFLCAAPRQRAPAHPGPVAHLREALAGRGIAVLGDDRRGIRVLRFEAKEAPGARQPLATIAGVEMLLPVLAAELPVSGQRF